jgi:ribosomal protein S25
MITEPTKQAMIHLIQHARSFGLKTLLQVQALDLMRREGFVSARTTADCLDVGVPSAMAVLNSLENRGLVEYDTKRKRRGLSRGGEEIARLLFEPATDSLPSGEEDGL